MKTLKIMLLQLMLLQVLFVSCGSKSEEGAWTMLFEQSPMNVLVFKTNQQFRYGAFYYLFQPYDMTDISRGRCIVVEFSDLQYRPVFDGDYDYELSFDDNDNTILYLFNGMVQGRYGDRSSVNDIRVPVTGIKNGVPHFESRYVLGFRKPTSYDYVEDCPFELSSSILKRFK